MYHDEQKSAGVTLSPKASFILGLVGGMLVLCTIGFFILLTMVLGGNGVSLGSKSAGSVAAAPSPSPSPAAPSDAGAAPTAGTPKAIGADDHVQGPKDAQVTLYEYSDFQCPFCQRFHPTMEQLMSDAKYKGKVRWVFRHFPLSFHPNALPAANAAECAAEQGKFWEFAQDLYINQDQESDAYYGKLADKLKLNRGKFDSCYSAKKYQAKIKAQEAEGGSVGITGTPGTIIVAKDGSTQLVPGAVPYEQLAAMVDAALAK